MKVSIVTLGCKVNQFESRALEEALEARGHTTVPFGEPADAVVVNSCTVTHRSDRDARALARRARRANPDARILVTGCYAQVDPEAVRRLGVDAVVGTGEKGAIPDLLDAGAGGVLVGDVTGLGELAATPVRRFRERSRAFCKVQDGCDAACTYCIVPRARGRSRSLPLTEVRRALARLRDSGHGEVVLTGVHLGLWGRGLEPPLPFTALLEAVETAGIPRVRLSSLEPGELTGEVIGAVGASQILCRHLHVPLQSGSDRVLSAMGRPYAAAEYRDRVAAALRALPGLCLGADVIVGFPGEDDAAFDETRKLVEAVPFAYLHVFPFSPRRGTRAWNLPGRAPTEKVRERARLLRAASDRKRREFHQTHLGRELLALPEGEAPGGALTARTRNYIPVRIPWEGAVPTAELLVRLEGLDGDVVVGRQID
jgi:threonylcarbamoyladenosine tRNA methylthiotransferase MtaB